MNLFEMEKMSISETNTVPISIYEEDENDFRPKKKEEDNCEQWNSRTLCKEKTFGEGSELWH